MAALGEVRHCDVVLKFIANLQSPTTRQIQSKLKSHRKDSSCILINELKKWTDRQMSLKWRAALEAALAGSQDTFGKATVDEMSRQILCQMVKDFLKYGNEAASPTASLEDLHRFRIVARKFRYTLELFEPLHGSSASNRGVARIKRAQVVLDDINDCNTIASCLAQCDGGNRLAGRLRKGQRKKMEEFRQYWSEAFRDGEQLRRWIDHLGRPTARPRGTKKPVTSSGHASVAHDRKLVAVA